MVRPPQDQLAWWRRLRLRLFGPPKEIHDVSVFHRLSLIPVLAWIGLGADGLSSSSYGPPEAYKAVLGHNYLSIAVGVATAATVFIISYTYTRIIEHFPNGGGGFVVASHMLGPLAGVVSGSALLLDYSLAITVSIATCIDSIFSFLPAAYHHLKLISECALILALIILNIRGVKESILALTPIFILFVATHALLFIGMIRYAPVLDEVTVDIQKSIAHDMSTIGLWGILLIFFKAYSLGGGTYTGLEAVSNGLPLLREPRVESAKRTMVYMALSLAITAGGLFICFVVAGIHPVEGKTLNAVLAEEVFRPWPGGRLLAFLMLLSEAALLIVGAQTGFTGGPRVMANMAVDSWLPHGLSSLSERLTMQNGVIMMGGAAIVLLLYTQGSVSALVIMFSINVFITFSLSQLGMVRFFLRHREDKWKRHLAVHLLGLVLCVTILVITVLEKFLEGGWLTLAVTTVIVVICFVIRGHYTRVNKASRKLDFLVPDVVPKHTPPEKPDDKGAPTAVLLVSGYNGQGIHTLLSMANRFGNCFRNLFFVSVAVIDSGTFKGRRELAALEDSVERDLFKYVSYAQRLGYPADARSETGTDIVDVAVAVCMELAREYPKTVVFMGQRTFELEKFYYRLLHNDTPFAIQRRLEWAGIPAVILPVKVSLVSKRKGVCAQSSDESSSERGGVER